MKKKVLAIVLTMAVLVSLIACGNNSATDKGNTNSTINQKDTSDQSSKSGDVVSTEGKVLVAYFAVAENSDVDAISSASVSDVNGETKGRMTALAEMIQDKTG